MNARLGRRTVLLSATTALSLTLGVGLGGAVLLPEPAPDASPPAVPAPRLVTTRSPEPQPAAAPAAPAAATAVPSPPIPGFTAAPGEAPRPLPAQSPRALPEPEAPAEPAPALDAALSPEERYLSLRRLEGDDPGAALDSALSIVRDPEKLADRVLGPNAVALLVRSEDARAEAALGALPPKYRRLARFLDTRTRR